MRSLVQEIINARNRRHMAVVGLRRGTEAWLTNAARERRATARREHRRLAHTRRDLANTSAQRMAEIGHARRTTARRLHADLAQGREAGKARASEWLMDVVACRKVQAHLQRAGLAKARADRVQGEAQRKGQVSTWLQGLAAAHSRARAEWHGLFATMVDSKGATTMVRGSTLPPPAQSAAPAQSGKQAADHQPGLRAAGRPFVGETADKPRENAAPGHTIGEASTLGERLFAFLARHPDGVRLPELEQQFGINRLHAAHLVAQLAKRGKVEKRDKLYFAV